jgi:hypothetical protein
MMGCQETAKPNLTDFEDAALTFLLEVKSKHTTTTSKRMKLYVHLSSYCYQETERPNT